MTNFGDMEKNSPVPKASQENQFAWLRTRLSIENTLLAWIRSATGLISFGFAIFEIPNRLLNAPGVAPPVAPQMPRNIAILLIAAGVGGLVVACWQYRWLVNRLWGPEFRPMVGVHEHRMQAPALMIAILVILIGILAIVAVVTRI